ncbi:MAG: prepilin peptidase [Chloroflexota bacterium]
MEPVAVVMAAAGGLLGFGADRLATRWPEHDEDDPAGRPIGWRTVVCVAIGASAFGLLATRFPGDLLATLAFGAWFVTLVVGLGTDLDQRLLPNVLTLPVIPLALAYAASGRNPLVGDAVVAAVLVAIVVPLVLYVPSLAFGAGAFGLGDVKLLVGAGLMLGLSRSLGGLVFGLLVAGVVLLLLLAARRIQRRSYVPFGPFLIVGALWGSLVLAG